MVMQLLKQRQPETERPPVKTGLRWSVLLEDLSLFLSFSLARIIVWRVLRARRRERKARLRSLRLVRGGVQQPVDDKAWAVGGMDEKGMLREAMRKNVFMRRDSQQA